MTRKIESGCSEVINLAANGGGIFMVDLFQVRTSLGKLKSSKFRAEVTPLPPKSQTVAASSLLFEIKSISLMKRL